MAKTPVLVACDVSRSLYVRLRDYGRGRYVTRAITVRELADQLHLSEASNGATVFLWEIDGNTTDEIVAAMDRGGASLRRAALLVLLPIGAVKARQVVMLVSRLPDAEVLLDGFDDVLQAVHRGVDGVRERQACQQMMGPRVSSVPATVSDIMTIAILSGRRRITVSTLARLCALPVRTLEWRLRACGAPEARRMLGWILSLHVLWRLDILRWTPKQAAAASDFRSVEAMSAFVARQTGCRPRAVMAAGGFERLLHACVERWQRGEGTDFARSWGSPT